MDASTRRDFITTSSRLFGGAWLAANMPSIEAAAARARVALEHGAAFETLTPAEARTIGAFAEQIIPSDETPGAREAGAVYFFDNILGGPMKQFLFPVRILIKSLDDKAKERHASAASFADLAGAQQIEIMKAIEQTQFFFLGRLLTVMGTFSDPKYGGGRDHVGARILGIDEQMSYQPPFGYYDAEAARSVKARQ